MEKQEATLNAGDPWADWPARAKRLGVLTTWEEFHRVMLSRMRQLLAKRGMLDEHGCLRLESQTAPQK